MSSLNVRPKPTPIYTHEGGKAVKINAEQQLRRSVLSCLLWESEFYENGVAIADRIEALADQVSKSVLSGLAVEARSLYHLRHVPLLLLSCLVKRGGPGVADTIAQVIQRPDEMMELLAIYWRKGKRPLAKQLQKGLAKAFVKFDEYQLAKYDRDGTILLRDVMFLAHPKPLTAEQAEMFKRVASRTLATPDTWEVELSAGKDKKTTFTRLIQEGKLGYLALLRNLRNMEQAGVDRKIVQDAIIARRNGAHRVLPFRYVAAARVVPSMERPLDEALLATIKDMKPLSGTTIVLVDVSDSMNAGLSAKSDLTRMDAAATLASIIPGDIRVFTFSYKTVEVPPRKGMAGIEAIIRSQRHGGTHLGAAITQINTIKHDRLIVITDEQSADRVPAPSAEKAYMINVASARNGVGYGGKWLHLDGFSENILRFIEEVEVD